LSWIIKLTEEASENITKQKNNNDGKKCSKKLWKNIKTKKQTKEEYNKISLDTLQEYIVSLNALRKNLFGCGSTMLQFKGHLQMDEISDSMRTKQCINSNVFDQNG
jgi:hypothetical protein